LQIHTHTLEEGWRALRGQRFDSVSSAFIGQGSGSTIIAILGPAEALKQVDAPETPESGPETAPSGDFLRTPLPAPVMEATVEGDQPEIAEAGDVTVAPEGALPVTEAAAPAEPRLYDIEYMEKPGAPEGEGEVEATEGEAVAEGKIAVEGTELPKGKSRAEKKAEKEARRQAEKLAQEQAAMQAEIQAGQLVETPRKAKKVRVDGATRSRAPRTNFN
jgi:hypothetical protein